MMKEKLEFSCNLRPLLSTRKNGPYSGMFRKLRFFFFDGNDISDDSKKETLANENRFISLD